MGLWHINLPLNHHNIRILITSFYLVGQQQQELRGFLNVFM